MRDDEIRARLLEWTRPLENVQPPDFSVIRNRGRRRVLGLVAGAVTVAAAGSAAVVFVALPALRPAGHAALNHPRPVPRSRDWHRAGPPPHGDAGPAAAPYFIQIFPPRKAEVVDAASGRVTATIRAPGRAVLAGVAAAGDDRTFIVAAGQPTVRYYELRLDRTGVPGPLWPLTAPRLSGQPLSFAASQDGGYLAISVTGSSPSSRAEVVVVALATGTTRTWRSPGPGLAADLSWAGNSLAFNWVDPYLPARVTDSRLGLRLLDTGKPGRNLLTSSRLLIPASARFGPYTGVVNPLITPDGSAVFDTMTALGGNPRSIVVEFAVPMGRPHAVSPPVDEAGHGAWCGAVWTDPSGRHALANCSRAVRIDNGRFTPVNWYFPGSSANPPGENFFAW